MRVFPGVPLVFVDVAPRVEPVDIASAVQVPYTGELKRDLYFDV